MSIDARNPDGLPPTTGYSHVVLVPAGASLVYVSGQVGLDADGALVGDGGFEAQARQAFVNLDTALKAVGSSSDRIIKIGLYLSDRAHLTTLRRIKNEFIDPDRTPPASTLLVVSGFFRPDLLVEVEATALVDG